MGGEVGGELGGRDCGDGGGDDGAEEEEETPRVGVRGRVWVSCGTCGNWIVRVKVIPLSSAHPIFFKYHHHTPSDLIFI